MTRQEEFIEQIAGLQLYGEEFVPSDGPEDSVLTLNSLIGKARELVKPVAGDIDEETKEKYRAAADKNHTREGELEIDPGAVVSKGDDDGAYVQAWIWVTDEEAGIESEEEDEG